MTKNWKLTTVSEGGEKRILYTIIADNQVEGDSRLPEGKSLLHMVKSVLGSPAGVGESQLLAAGVFLRYQLGEGRVNAPSLPSEVGSIPPGCQEVVLSAEGSKPDYCVYEQTEEAEQDVGGKLSDG
jgi:hypothetical protein